MEVCTNLATGTFTEAEGYRQAEVIILKKVQQESFSEDYQRLMAGNSARSGSRLVTLTPEIDLRNGLIRVGGRLRRATGVDPSTIHPLVLAPNHPVTRLIIHHYDHQLHHSGSERLFAEIRRYYWILCYLAFSSKVSQSVNDGQHSPLSQKCLIYPLHDLPFIPVVWIVLDLC